MKNQAFHVMDNLVIVIHGPMPPSDEEARHYLTALSAMDITRMRCLIFTEGGAPSAAQRKALNDALGGRDFPTAVVTNLPMVRGVVTALSWFNKKIKAFAPEAVDDAFQYLGIQPSKYAAVWTEIRRLRTELGGKNFKSIVR